MLLLKLTLVPGLLVLVTLAARRWGPSAGGALAGMPWVVAPILLVLLLERGAVFTAQASSAAFVSVAASCAYIVGIARASDWLGVTGALVLGFVSWLVVAALLVWNTPPIWLAAMINLGLLLALPMLIPAGQSAGQRISPPAHDLLVRMVVGAALTLLVSALASRVGTQWSGVLAAFPVITVVLGAMTRIGYGTAYMNALFRGMAMGYYSLAAFSLTLAMALPRFGAWAGYLIACLVCALVQWLVRAKTRPANV